MAVYSVFGDESADEKKQRVFAVAGVFGQQEHWDALVKRWTKRTGGAEFHGTEWERDNPKEYAELVKILAASRLSGWGAAMSLLGQDEIFDNALLNFQYYLCFVRVVDHFGRYTKLCIPHGTVDFTMDHVNGSIEYNTGLLYREMAESPEWADSVYLEKDLSFSSRKNPKIQIADLWTREVMKHMDNTIVHPISLPMRKSLVTLRRTRRFAFDMYDRRYFEDMERRVSENRPGFSEYPQWLAKHKRQDNTENRIRYEIYLNRLDRQKGGAK